LDWGQGKELARIDRELARRDPDGQRGWYVNRQGQTLTVIRGPVGFRMGSAPTETERSEGTAPHRRIIDRHFAVATKPVTRAQWERFRKEWPLESAKRYSPEPDGPMLSITWYDATQYCNWLSAQEGIPPDQWCYPRTTGESSAQVADLMGTSVQAHPGTPWRLALQLARLTRPGGDILPIGVGLRPWPDYLRRTGYRLPTEAEWEYACRAGATTSRYFGSTAELLSRYAWYNENSQNRTWPVGQKRPNDLGLFDLHGNVLNWCQDRAPTLGNDRLDDRENTNEISDASIGVLRGGYFNSNRTWARSSFRKFNHPFLRNSAQGLRVCRTWE
jgi:formylglycine-generating enzyme required for sulfatase activity